MERIKEFIISGRITGIEFFNEFEVKEEFDLSTDEHKDLWLKVLSKCLETNEVLSRAWTKAPHGNLSPFKDEYK